MRKRTLISSLMLFASICILTGFSIGLPNIWTIYLSHWTVLFSIALIMTLLVSLVLMDELFEFDNTLVMSPGSSSPKIEVKRYFILAFSIVCIVAIILEVVQFSLSTSTVSVLDPLIIIAGSASGVFLHIIGSSMLMKRVEFELERWEDNVL